MRARLKAFLALGVFAAAAIVATWPLILSPGHRIAGGPGDPILTTAILAWDADRLAHGLRQLWDAPWLFPHRHTLAYAEHLLGIAVFTAPIQWLTGNPVLAYNAAYIGSYVFAGLAMFLLTRELWGRADAAVLAGLTFELTPYRLAQTSHLQMLVNGWMPIGLLALHRYFATGSRRWLAAFVAAFVTLALSNGYYLYFFLIPVAVLTGVEITRRAPPLPRARIALDLTAAGAAIAGAIAPIAFVYYRLQREHGFARNVGRLGSAELADFFRVAPGAWNWGGLLSIGVGERELFHGFVILVFAAIGAATIVQHGQRRLVATYLLMTALAAWLATGPGPLSAYGLLFRLLPGFSGLRVPARLASVVVLALAVLAGAGFAWLLARLRRRSAAMVAVGLALLLVLEGQHGIQVAAAPDLKARSWDGVAYEWLRTSPPGGVLELNVTPLDDLQPFTPVYQLRALTHRHPIVNGYAGWRSAIQELLGSNASPLREPGRAAEGLRGLRAIGVRYILLHEASFANPDQAARMVVAIRECADQIAEEREWPGTWAWRLANIEPAGPLADIGLRPLDHRLFSLTASGHEDRLPLLFDADIDTRWISGDPQDGGEWIEIRFPRPVDVGRLRFETESSRSVTDYPRRLTIDSSDGSAAPHRLFDAGVSDRFIAALAADERRAPLVIDLPRNRTTTLRIGQTARGTTWWAIHELRLWERPMEMP